MGGRWGGERERGRERGREKEEWGDRRGRGGRSKGRVKVSSRVRLDLAVLRAGTTCLK